MEKSSRGLGGYGRGVSGDLDDERPQWGVFGFYALGALLVAAGIGAFVAHDAVLGVLALGLAIASRVTVQLLLMRTRRATTDR